MINKRYLLSISVLFPWTSWAIQSFYCTQNHGYISIGMTKEQVISACGQPYSKQKSNKPATQQVAVQQIFYNRQGAKKSFYGVWAMPIGNATSPAVGPTFGNNGGGGSQLQINVIDNKISSIIVDNARVNAFSICGGYLIEIGDLSGKLYGACGTPSLVNNTYIDQPIASLAKPDHWIYEYNTYQAPIDLTFIDDKLQSID